VPRLRRRRAPTPDWAPEPPVTLPPGRLVHVPGRGEFFLRDTGGAGPPVLLLHGWMFPSDLNWWTCYDALAEAGYRVLAVDHRGHGRGLRTTKAFRLEDCAADAAAVVAEIGCGPVIATGYSMGGAIAQLMARDHRACVAGLVLCATSRDWQDVHLKLFWRAMGGLRLGLGVFPTRAWSALLAGARVPKGSERTWLASELSRGSSEDIAEAGRELGRYDARSWIGSLDVPAAVVVTTRDLSVPPRKQRALARSLRATSFGVRADHMAAATHPEAFRRALLAAVASVASVAPGADAAAEPARAA
jgi:3-oxoadipate enol-lactonase